MSLHANTEGAYTAYKELEELSESESGSVLDLEAESKDNESESESVNVGAELSKTRISLGTVTAFAGDFVFAIEAAFVTPAFLMLKIPLAAASVAWAAPPVIGMVAQILVGRASDRCTSRFGRRTPFVAICMLLCLIGLLAFANLTDLEDLMPLGGVFAISFVAFVLMDGAMEALLAISRQRQVEAVPASQHEQVNAIFGVWSNMGCMVGYVCGGWDAITFLRPQIRAVCVLACILLVICVSITFVAVKEPAIATVDLDKSEEESFVSRLRSIRLSTLPKVLLWACGIQFFGWSSILLLFFYGTDWMATKVLLTSPIGSPSDIAAYEAAIRVGSLSLAVFGGVGMVVSFFIPWLVGKVKIRPSYFMMTLITSIAYFCMYYVKPGSLAPAFICVGLTGMGYAAALNLPFQAIAGLTDSDGGLYMGILTSSMLLAQLFVSSLGALLTHLTQNVSVFCIAGGIMSLCASLMCLIPFSSS